jgi:hypothetical protein
VHADPCSCTLRISLLQMAWLLLACWATYPECTGLRKLPEARAAATYAVCHCHRLRPFASSMLVGKPPMSEILLIIWKQQQNTSAMQCHPVLAAMPHGTPYSQSEGRRVGAQGSQGNGSRVSCCAGCAHQHLRQGGLALPTCVHLTRRSTQ